MNTTKTDILIKHSGFIAISNKISLLQRKLFNFLVAYAYSLLKSDEIYEIPLKLLKSKLWFNSKNSEYFKESLKKLISTVVEFNLLWKDRDTWSASALLASVSFKDKKLYYSFSPLLRDKLYQPNIYSKLNLNCIKLFSSKYSLCLYEIIVDYRKIRQTPFITVETFKKLMGVDDWTYLEFKRLKARVIQPALDELNRVTGLEATMLYQKKWRSIKALKFIIHELKEVEPMRLSVETKKIQANTLLYTALVKEFGLTLRQATTVIKNYPIPYITESLQIIKTKRAQGVIKNIPAYTLTVLKNDYIQLSNPKEQSLLWCTDKSWQKREAEMVQSKSTTMRNLLCTKDNHSVSSNQKKAQKYFESLTKKEQWKLIKRFEEEKITSDVLVTLYKKNSISSPLFKVMFENFIVQYRL